MLYNLLYFLFYLVQVAYFIGNQWFYISFLFLFSFGSNWSWSVQSKRKPFSI